MDNDHEADEIRQSTAGFNLIFLHSSVDDAGLDPHTFRVLAHLSRRAGGASGSAFGSVDNMAKTCKMDRKSVFKALETLTVLGFIRKTARPGKPSIIRVLPPQEAAKTKKEPKAKTKEPADPRVREFLTMWCKEYEMVFGMEYVVHWGADGKAVKTLLATADTKAEDLVRVAAEAWQASGNRNVFALRFANEIRSFCAHFNEVRRTLAEINGKRVKQPTVAGSSGEGFGIATGADL